MGAEVETKDVAVTEEGTILETLRIVDVSDPFQPVRLRVVEWLDEAGHYRDFPPVAEPGAYGSAA